MKFNIEYVKGKLFSDGASWRVEIFTGKETAVPGAITTGKLTSHNTLDEAIDAVRDHVSKTIAESRKEADALEKSINGRLPPTVHTP